MSADYVPRGSEPEPSPAPIPPVKNKTRTTGQSKSDLNPKGYSSAHMKKHDLELRSKQHKEMQENKRQELVQQSRDAQRTQTQPIVQTQPVHSHTVVYGTDFDHEDAVGDELNSESSDDEDYDEKEREAEFAHRITVLTQAKDDEIAIYRGNARDLKSELDNLQRKLEDAQTNNGISGGQIALQDSEILALKRNVADKDSELQRVLALYTVSEQRNQQLEVDKAAYATYYGGYREGLDKIQALEIELSKTNLQLADALKRGTAWEESAVSYHARGTKLQTDYEEMCEKFAQELAGRQQWEQRAVTAEYQLQQLQLETEKANHWYAEYMKTSAVATQLNETVQKLEKERTGISTVAKELQETRRKYQQSADAVTSMKATMQHQKAMIDKQTEELKLRTREIDQERQSRLSASQAVVMAQETPNIVSVVHTANNTGYVNIAMYLASQYLIISEETAEIQYFGSKTVANPVTKRPELVYPLLKTAWTDLTSTSSSLSASLLLDVTTAEYWGKVRDAVVNAKMWPGTIEKTRYPSMWDKVKEIEDTDVWCYPGHAVILEAVPILAAKYLCLCMLNASPTVVMQQGRDMRDVARIHDTITLDQMELLNAAGHALQSGIACNTTAAMMTTPIVLYRKLVERKGSENIVTYELIENLQGMTGWNMIQALNEEIQRNGWICPNWVPDDKAYGML